MTSVGGWGGDSALTAPSLNRQPHTRAHTSLQTGQGEGDLGGAKRIVGLLIGREKLDQVHLVCWSHIWGKQGWSPMCPTKIGDGAIGDPEYGLTGREALLFCPSTFRRTRCRIRLTAGQTQLSKYVAAGGLTAVLREGATLCSTMMCYFYLHRVF